MNDQATVNRGALRVAAQRGRKPYRVMIVDDSAVIRGFIARALEPDPDVEVAESVGNGELALKAIARNPVDVVVLDIEMPVMDGLTALPRLLRAQPGVKVIMASTLTRKNAAISLNALAAGASDYVPKPTSGRDLRPAGDFQRELVDKIKALASVRRVREAEVDANAAPARGETDRVARVTLRKPSACKPEVLAVGSSTGGPQALFTLFGALKSTVAAPVFVTQHMPPTFTSLLAEHLQRVTGVPCTEARDNETPEARHIYLAPGDYRMTVVRQGERRVLRVSQAPPVNFCRPAVDPMLRSLAAAYGPHVLAIMLTGMGHDGLKGSEAVVAAGGTVLAQDEKTSVVWGMPGAVASAGLASAMLPIDKLAAEVRRLFEGAGP